MYTHYTTTKNKQQFNSIWLNLQHTHIALCCKGTWVTYMKKEVLLVKKKNYYSLISSYNLHCTSVCQRVNHGRKIKPELTFYVQTATRFHGAWLTMCLALNWGYIKKTIFDHCKAITTLYTRVCLLQSPTIASHPTQLDHATLNKTPGLYIFRGLFDYFTNRDPARWGLVQFNQTYMFE